MSASPLDLAKTAQGFVGATSRKRCATCNLVTTNYGPDTLSCGPGRFMVSKYAVCDKWEPKALGSFHGVKSRP